MSQFFRSSSRNPPKHLFRKWYLWRQSGEEASRSDHPAPPSVALAIEHYKRLQRLSEHEVLARVEFEVMLNTSARPWRSKTSSQNSRALIQKK